MVLAEFPYVVLDVFTDTPLEGNPVAVFTDADGITPERMQRLAAETNLSETVFLMTPDDGEAADARIRIFTPTVEMPFAGHPTLGTAFLVGQRDNRELVRLQTERGIVPVALTRAPDSGSLVYGVMEQPLPTWTPLADVAALSAALDDAEFGLPVEIYDNGARHMMVDLNEPSVVSGMQPDLTGLAAFGEVGVYVFARDGEGCARARLFASGLGVSEDPATGSAAGPLAVHLCRHGALQFGETLTVTQGVEMGRPSILRATAFGSGDTVERVTVGGCAVPVARGVFALPG